MLVCTGQGEYWTFVQDFDSDDLWLRSQDEQSVRRAAATLDEGREPREVIVEPTWDYLARIRLTKAELGMLLADRAATIDYHKLKPAVAAARGKTHPVSRMVEEVFYYMSYNRPDRSKPGWVTGTPRKR